jgi:hypothetical protein
VMPPEKLVIIDYCGTLSLEAPRFGRSEILVHALEGSGLAALGVSTPEIFWGNIVNPTWIDGSTTSVGYAQVIAGRIATLDLAPDTQINGIEAAASRFVAMYLASSWIDPHWRPILARLSEQPAAIAVIATDHYAEVTGKLINDLKSWGIPTLKIGKGEEPPTSSATRFFIANSADLGVWKKDRRFWEILKSQLPLAAVRRVLLIDDFGFNEESGDIYSGQAKVLARQEKTIANLEETFHAVVEVAPFYLPEEKRAWECEETGARLIAKTAARIEAFLERR